MIKSYIIFAFSVFGVFYLASYIIHLGSGNAFDVSFSSFILSLQSLEGEFDIKNVFFVFSNDLNLFVNACDKLTETFVNFGSISSFKELGDFFVQVFDVIKQFFTTLLSLFVGFMDFILYIVRLIYKFIRYMFG